MCEKVQQPVHSAGKSRSRYRCAGVSRQVVVCDKVDQASRPLFVLHLSCVRRKKGNKIFSPGHISQGESRQGITKKPKFSLAQGPAA